MRRREAGPARQGSARGVESVALRRPARVGHGSRHAAFVEGHQALRADLADQAAVQEGARARDQDSSQVKKPSSQARMTASTTTITTASAKALDIAERSDFGVSDCIIVFLLAASRRRGRPTPLRIMRRSCVGRQAGGTDQPASEAHLMV